MKVFTLLLFILLNSFNSLFAVEYPYPNPVDTMALAVNPGGAEEEHIVLPPITVPTAEALSLEAILSPTWTTTCDNCGSGTGTIELFPDPNTPGPYLFMWSNGETTQNVTGLTAGVYTVTIFDANQMMQQAQIIVSACPPIAPLDVTGIVTGNTVCNGPGGGNGAIDLTVTPDPTVFTYLWSNGATDMDITDLDPGLYTVSVTYGVTCTTIETFNVPNLTDAPIFIPPIQGFGYDFCELGNGWAVVGVQGGVQPYTFEWSNGGTTQQINDLVAGTYTVTVTGANGCTLEHEETVLPSDLPVFVTENVVNPNTTCIGANGSVSIQLSPAGAWQNTATYLWSNGATTMNLTNVPSGSYRVTVTRMGTCTATEVWYVEDEPNIPSLTFTNTAASCGLSNGAVNLTTLPGGVPPFTYMWSSGQTTEDLAMVPAGSYDVTLTSANGCTTTGNAMVDDNQAIFSYSAVVTDNTSCDTIDGRISLSLFPNNLAYTWSNGATTTNLINLAPGDYTVTISAGGTCTAVETYSVGSVFEYPSIPALVDTATCGLANGGIDLTVNGGLSPFTYLWSNGATTQDLINLKADTLYVTVTSAVGCATQNVVIVPNVNAPIGIASNVADNISCTAPSGYIGLTINPVDTSYVYTWSNGATTDSLSNLSGGTYLVTVTLGLTCIALDTFDIIDQASAPNLAVSSVSTSCDFNNGTIDLTVSNGSAPFAYLWSNGATDEDLSNLPPGTYSVTVTGVNTCSAVSSATILNNTVSLSVNGTPVENSSCAAGNGSVDIVVAPAGTYIYLWSNAETTEDLNNLTPGSYTVTVSLGTCLSSSTFVVQNNALPPNITGAGTAASCDFANGAADLNVNGGTGPFTYLWSNAATDEDLVNLAPGTYTVTVTGANACTEVSSVTVLNNNIALNLSGTAIQNSSCVAANGSLDLDVTPTGAYAYLWSNAATDEDLTNLAAGTYTVTVSLGTCQSTNTFIVADNTLTPTLSTTITASICSVDNGAIDLSVSGPSGPYTYLWSNAATDEDLAALFPGNYSVTVTATNGCTEVASLNVPNNATNFSLAGASAPLTDCSTNNGAINLNITPAGSYTYLWSNAATDEDLSGLAPGTYTVSVTESGSCTATASFFVIDQRTNPVASQTLTPELCGLADGSIDLSVLGGTAPYSFAWSSGQVTEDLANLSAGTYTVLLTDANNCTATASATVPGNAINFSLAGTASPNSSCIQNNGSVDLTLNPPTGYTFTWSNGSMTEDLVNISAGSYTVTVSAGGNCTSTANFTIASNVPTPQIAQTIVPSDCGQADGSIDLSISGSPAPFQYFWSNGSALEDLTNILAGSYSVIVTAANGCTSVGNYTVTDNIFVPNIGSSLTPATSCVVNNGAVDLTITPSMGYTFVWSNGSLTEDLSNVAAGTYSVTVSAGGACTSTAVVTVASNVPPPVIANNIAAATCGQASGNIDLSISGSPAPYLFNWSTGAVLEDLSGLLSGTYSVTVTAGNGCTTVDSFVVPEDVIIPAITGAPSAANSCLSANGAINLTVTPALTYTFNWSNGGLTEDLSSLAAGSYTVTVNGGGSCISTASFVIVDQTTQPQANITTQSNTLDCNTVSILLNGTVTGTPNGTTTEWLNNGNVLGSGNTLQVTTPGQYQFVVVDNVTFCSATASVTINQNLNPPALSIANPALLTCIAPSQVLSGSSTVGGVQFSWATIVGTDTTLVGSGATLPVNTPGTYFLIGVNPVNNCANAVPVNVLADQVPPGANAGQPFTLDCAGETAPLGGSGSGAPNLTFQWTSQDGNFVSGTNTATPLIDEAGTYVLTVTNPANGCTETDEVVIVPEVPMVFASVTQPNCNETVGRVQIDSVSGLSAPFLFSFNNGPLSIQNQYSNVVPGVYTVSVEGGNGCVGSTSVTVSPPTPLMIGLVTEAEIRMGYGYQIDATVNIPSTDIASVTWTPATGLECATCLNTLATPLLSTTYEVLVVSEAGCEARGNFTLIVDRTRQVYGPNIFSPNDDGRNDIFTLYADPITVTRIKSLQVFSRWGEAIFELENVLPGDESIGWDGTFKGQKLNPAVFVWQAVVEFVDGQEEVFSGDVTLQR